MGDEQALQIDTGAVLTASVGNGTRLELCLVCLAHRLHDGLLQLRLDLLATFYVSPHGNEISEHGRQPAVVREIDRAARARI